MLCWFRSLEQESPKKVKQETFVVKVRGLSHTVPSSWIESTFKRYGEVHSIEHEVSGREERTAFICYGTYEAAQAAVQEMNGEMVADEPLRVELHHQSSLGVATHSPTTTGSTEFRDYSAAGLSSIKLTNIPQSLREATLLEKCRDMEGFVNLKLVEVKDDSTNYAWVNVKSSNADVVWRALNGMMLDGFEIKAGQPRLRKFSVSDQGEKPARSPEPFSFKLSDSSLEPVHSPRQEAVSSSPTINLQEWHSLPRRGSLFQPIRYGLDLSTEHSAMLSTLTERRTPSPVHSQTDKSNENKGLCSKGRDDTFVSAQKAPPSLSQSKTEPLMLSEAASLIDTRLDEKPSAKVSDIPQNPASALRRSQTAVLAHDQKKEHRDSFSWADNRAKHSAVNESSKTLPSVQGIQNIKRKPSPKQTALSIKPRPSRKPSSVSPPATAQHNIQKPHVQLASDSPQLQGNSKRRVPSLERSQIHPIVIQTTTVIKSSTSPSRSPPATVRRAQTAHATLVLKQQSEVPSEKLTSASSSEKDREQNPFKKALARRPSPVPQTSTPLDLNEGTVQPTKQEVDTVNFAQPIIKRILVLKYKTELEALQNKHGVFIRGKEVDGVALTLASDSKRSVKQAKSEILDLTGNIHRSISDVTFTVGCWFLPCLANSDTVTQLQTIEKKHAVEFAVFTANSEMSLTECSELLRAKLSESEGHCLCLSQVHSFTEMRLGYYWKVQNATTGELVGFEHDTNMQINVAYTQRESTCSFLYSGHSYTVDFTQMTVTDKTDGGQVHSLTREPVWCRYTDEDFGYKPLRESISAILESTFQQSAPGLIEIEGEQCVVDFYTDPMQVYSANSPGKRCSIQRNPAAQQLVPALSIRMRGMAEKPTATQQVFCSTLQEKVITEPVDIPPKIANKVAELLLLGMARQYCVQCTLSEDMSALQLTGTKEVVTDVSMILMKEIMRIMSSSDMAHGHPTTPPNWAPQTKDVELYPVARGSSEWSHIEDLMKESLNSVKIKAIERIQNRCLWQKYCFFRRILTERMNGKSINEKELFHGTRSNHPSKIYESDKGFDFRFGSSDSLWGQGSYFAVKASYSDHGYAYSPPGGSKQLILARVVTGECLCENTTENECASIEAGKER